MNLERIQCITANCAYNGKETALRLLRRGENEEGGDFLRGFIMHVPIIFCCVWSCTRIIIKLYSVFLKVKYGHVQLWWRGKNQFPLQINKTKSTINMPSKTKTQKSLQKAVLWGASWVFCPPLSLSAESWLTATAASPRQRKEVENPFKKRPLFCPFMTWLQLLATLRWKAEKQKEKNDLPPHSTRRSG